MPSRILIAGIGNIFFGDDGFGVEVVRRLAQREWPDHVRVIDFGIRGFDLAMALLEDFSLVILVDATLRGGPPGTLYVIEADPDVGDEPAPAGSMVDPHSLDPVKVLALAKTMGGRPGRVLVVGCEPATTGLEEAWDVTAGLSEPVQLAVEEAVALVESLVGDAQQSHLILEARTS